MPEFHRLRRYLSIPSRSATRIAREVDEELQHHIQLRTEEFVRDGMQRGEARARAMREFGDIDDAAQYCATVDGDAERRRSTRGWWAEVWQDATHAVRVLRRAPAFAAATVVTLALAIGASTAVFGVLDAYLIRPLPFPHSDRLMSIGNAPTAGNSRRGPDLRNVDWTRVDSLFEATAAWDLDGFTISGEPYAESATGAWVTPGYFVSLGLQPAIGRPFRSEEYRAETPVAIISHQLWVRRFGADRAVLGKVVTMHSTDRPASASRVTIIGVLPRGLWPIQWRVSDVLRPMPPDPHSMPTLARLAPNRSRQETEDRFNATVRAQIAGPVDSSWLMSIIPALERHSSRVRPLLFSVLGAALFMLLAACGSVAGALVSRTASRQSELAIRLALGGSRARVARQLLTESAVLATLAGALGMVFAYALLSATGVVVERQLGTSTPGGPGALRPTLAIMAQCLIVSAATGVALGALPALSFIRGQKRKALTALLGGGRSGSARSGGAHVRRILIAAQVTIATVLLFGAGLMFRTLSRMNGVDVGFHAAGVVRGSLLLPLERYPDSATKRQAMSRLLDGMAHTPGVRGAATVAPSPFGWSWRFPVLVDGSGVGEDAAPRAAQFTVSPEYFATMELRTVAGRVFRPSDDQSAPLVVVISEGLASRIAPEGGVIGRRIRVRVPYLASFDDPDERPWRTVVGVVNDTRKDFENTVPDIYVPYAQNPRSFQSLVIRAHGDESAIVEPVRRAIARVDPALALFDVTPLSDVIASYGAQRRGLSVLLGSFAAFSLGLSALALYASLTYTVVQRRSELAVRVAVGANVRSILGLVVTEGLVTAVVGVIAGVIASLGLGRVLGNQLYGIGPTDPGTLATISLVLVATAVAACLVPGIRATKTDPALALRE
jgi:predicted permease